LGGGKLVLNGIRNFTKGKRESIRRKKGKRLKVKGKKTFLIGKGCRNHSKYRCNMRDLIPW